MTATYTYETFKKEKASHAAACVNALEHPIPNAHVAVCVDRLADANDNGSMLEPADVVAFGSSFDHVKELVLRTFSDIDATGHDNTIVIVRTRHNGEVDKWYAPLVLHIHHEQDASDEQTDSARDAPDMEFCACCGELHPADELIDTANGDMVCADCIERYYKKCDHCGKWTPTENLESVYNDDYRQTLAGLWCLDCIEEDAHVCDECGLCFTSTYIDDVYSQAHGCVVNICSNCADDRFVVCEDCGELVGIDYATHHDDVWYCSSCAPDMCSDYVREYGSTYAVRFLALDNENANRACVPYLGIELETDCSGCFEEAAAMLDSAFGDDADLKQDSSIGDGGIEIAAQPQTPAFALSDEIPWSYVLKQLTRYGATSHDAGTCGFHIHIDRAFLDAPYMACTLDRLFQTHKEEWRVFSRRTPGQIDSWSKFGYIGHEYGLTPKQKREAWDKEKRRYDRYQVVNLSNSDTIEIRLWRGTLREKTFRATIEATAALAYLAHDLSETEAEDVELWTWPSLTLHMVNTLKKYRLPYVDLLGYLYERGL